MNCPYIDSNHTLCSRHLNMQHLDNAFEFCYGRYMLCPIYFQISHEQDTNLELAVAASAAHEAP